MATIRQTNNSEPGTPSPGTSEIYVDSATKKLRTKDDSGVVIDYTEADVSTVQLATGQADPSHSEGLIFYDDAKKAASYYNEEADVKVNLGQELVFRVYNSSGSTITNGQVIYPNGNTIGLANASVKDKSRLIAVATHDIENNSFGYITKVGQVGGLDTSSYSVGDVIYLSAVTDGAFGTVKPDDGGFIVTVGVVDVADATDGIITVDITTSDMTVEVTDTNGFPLDQRTGTTLLVTEATRTFYIAPVGASFHFYELGDKYEKTTSQDVTWTDVEGEHWFYFNGGVLTHLSNPTIEQRTDIILKNAFIAYIYWNATDKEVVYDIAEERHGISMSPYTHLYLHLTRGAAYNSGMAVGDVISTGDGSLDTHAQYSVTAGSFFDEDILHITESKAVGDTYPVGYLLGSSNFRVGEKATFALLTGPNNRPYYNENVGGTWQLTEVADRQYVLYHLFATNGVNKQIISIMGQNEYARASDARAGASTEIGSISAGFEIAESVPIATFIYDVRNSYGNSVNAKIIQTEDGDDFIDWRTSELAQGAAPTNHDNLAGLTLAASGNTYGHIDDQAQTLAGIKTFTSFPITPTAEPTTDYQVANKKYVDDNAGGTVSNHFQFGRWFNSSLFNAVEFPPSINWPDDGTGAPGITLQVDDASTLKIVTFDAVTNSTTSFDLNIVINGTPTVVGSVTSASQSFTGLSVSLAAGDSITFNATNVVGGSSLKGVCIVATLEV